MNLEWFNSYKYTYQLHVKTKYTTWSNAVVRYITELTKLNSNPAILQINDYLYTLNNRISENRVKD